MRVPINARRGVSRAGLRYALADTRTKRCGIEWLLDMLGGQLAQKGLVFSGERATREEDHCGSLTRCDALELPE